MANSNVTVVRSQSQFKDYVSVRERLLICGINCDFKKSPVKNPQSVKKNDQGFGRSFLRSKTVLA